MQIRIHLKDKTMLDLPDVISITQNGAHYYLQLLDGKDLKMDIGAVGEIHVRQ